MLAVVSAPVERATALAGPSGSGARAGNGLHAAVGLIATSLGATLGKPVFARLHEQPRSR